jgi:hypothetical protein
MEALTLRAAPALSGCVETEWILRFNLGFFWFQAAAVLMLIARRML